MCTQRATPLGVQHVIFLHRRSKRYICVSSWAYHLFKFGWVEAAWHYINTMVWCHLSSSAQSCTLSFNSARSPRLYHSKPCMSLFPVLHCAVRNNRALHPLYIMHVLWAMQVQTEARNPHFVSCFQVTFQQSLFSPPHTAFKYLLQVLKSARYDQECRRPPKRNAKTKPQERQERTSLCVPRYVRAAPSEPGGQLCLRFLCDFQPQNFTIKLGSHVEENVLHSHCWCNPKLLTVFSVNVEQNIV